MDSVMAMIGRVPLVNGFRNRYGYTNLAFVVAGQVLASVSGQGWEQFIGSRLLAPLGMTRSTTSVADLASRDNVASPHAIMDGELRPVPYRPIGPAAAAGAINSSAREWAQWIRLQLSWGSLDGRRIVDSAIIAETRTPQLALRNRPHPLYPGFNIQSYGLGWFIRDFRGNLEVTHDGGMDGMYSKAGFLPQRNIGVVVLTNADEHDLQTALYYHIMELLLGPSGHDWSATLLAAQRQSTVRPPQARREGSPPLPLAHYAGRYHNSIMGDLTIRLTPEGRLAVSAQHHQGLRADLSHWEENVFVASWADRYFRESRLTFDVQGGRVQGVRFTVRPDFIDPLEYDFRRVATPLVP
ncbi:MAG TPA: serine hydrolase [Reyranella sp.]|nr:serine hydrolase [Reyranella sp.]